MFHSPHALKAVVITTMLAVFVTTSEARPVDDSTEPRQKYIIPLKDSGVVSIDALSSQDQDPTNDFRMESVYPNLNMATVSIPVLDTLFQYNLMNEEVYPNRNDFELHRLNGNEEHRDLIGFQIRDDTITQPNAGYALDILDGAFDGQYDYSSATGEGVEIVIFDTGIRPDHTEWGGRTVKCLYTAFPSEGCEDGQPEGGHGTFVASNAAGMLYGTAKGADISAAKIFANDGSIELDFILAAADTLIDETKRNPNKRYVANMSIGTVNGRSIPVENAVRELVNNNVVVVVSAGNSESSACGQSPAASDVALTVGATDRNDNPTSFSNWGPCVDLWAPGLQVDGASHIGPPNSATIKSGTSMSSPYTAGMAAIFLSLYPDMNPAGIVDLIQQHAFDVINDPRTPTGLRLSNRGTFEDEPSPPTPPPTMEPTMVQPTPTYVPTMEPTTARPTMVQPTPGGSDTPIPTARPTVVEPTPGTTTPPVMTALPTPTSYSSSKKSSSKKSSSKSSKSSKSNSSKKSSKKSKLQTDIVVDNLRCRHGMCIR